MRRNIVVAFGSPSGMACRQGAIEDDHVILARKGRSEAAQRSLPKPRVDRSRWREMDVVPPLRLEGSCVVGRALPVRLSSKPEQPVNRFGIAINVVRVALADPTGVGL